MGINTVGGQIGMQAAGGVVGGIFDAINAKRNDKRQVKMMQKAAEINQRGMRENAELNYQNQMRLWNETNYTAQKEHMKKAGLNPALMYGMGGGGGATAAAQPGQSPGATGAIHGGDMAGAVTGGMGMGMNMALMQSNKALIDSQARLNNVEADKKQGVDTEEAESRILKLSAETDNTRANTMLTRANTTLAELQGQFDAKTMEDRMDMIEYTTSKAMQELRIAANEANMSDETYNEQVKIIQEAAIGAYLNNLLVKEQTTKTKSDVAVNTASIKKMNAEVLQGWEKLCQGWQQLSNDQQRIEIENFNALIKANYPSISATLGRWTNDALTILVEKVTGRKRKKYEEK